MLHQLEQLFVASTASTVRRRLQRLEIALGVETYGDLEQRLSALQAAARDPTVLEQRQWQELASRVPEQVLCESMPVTAQAAQRVYLAAVHRWGSIQAAMAVAQGTNRSIECALTGPC